MNIGYQVLAHEGDHAIVRIHMPVPLNGFHGCDLDFRRKEDEGKETFIEQRVQWKVNQELGETAMNCTVTKI